MRTGSTIPPFPGICRHLIYGVLCLLIVLNQQVLAQSADPFRELSGTITSEEDGQPLPGASVSRKGTSVGVVADLNGYYVIKVMPGDTLIYSYAGFLSAEQPVNNLTIFNISLAADEKALDEIVIVGYGSEKRSNLTGSITSVKAEQLENRPITRLDQALQGMSSGVFVSKGGGAPGAAPSIHIRGIGSIGNTEPLWIVDGIKMNPGNHFNIDDIESVEILKDAASSAIYGAEAAHGVILITTKKGKKGKTEISYSSSFAKVNPIELPTLLGSQDFVFYKKQSRLNAGQNPEPSWDNYAYDTDWIDAFYGGSGLGHFHNFSIAKGVDRSSYFLSLGYDREDGILLNNSFERFSVRLNSEYQLADWITLGENILLSRVNEDPINNFNEDYNGAIPFRSIPIMPVYDETNPFGGWGRAPVYFQGPNPVATQYQQHETRNYNRLNGTLYLALQPIRGFTLRGQVGYNYLSYFSNGFNEAFDYGAFANPINALTYATSNDENITANLVASYERGNATHNFKILAGYELNRFDNNHFNASATDFPLEVAQSFNLATGTFTVTDRFNVYQRRLLSQFGRLTYQYKGKYLFEANIRRDASAPAFSPENIWGVFPSFSAGWNISREPFMERFTTMQNIKLRASVGTLGSDKIGNFLYAKTYTSQFDTYTFDATGQQKEVGFYISRFPNADVKWEEVKMYDVGLDAELLDGNIGFSLDYYIKETSDLLYAVPIPASVGIATHNFDAVNPEVNIGSMRNTGIDLDLRWRKSISDFKLTVNSNVSYLKNEIISLNGDEYITGGGGGGQIGGMTRTQAGMPISSFYGFVVQQMLNSEDDVFAVNSFSPDGIYQEAGTGPGDFMYVDLSGPDGAPDGKITWEHDRTFIGNPWPKFMFGLNVNLNYKNRLDLLLQFQGVADVDVFNANLAYSRNFFGDANTTTAIYEAWTPENHTQHPRNIASDPNGNWSRPSTYFIEDGSYVKLRNAQIGFSFPQTWLQRMGKLQQVRFYLHASNLLTISGYSGADPEIAGSNTSRGVDYGLYPHTRTFGGGIDVKF
jgi:TonB-linked SusC/RagA family outer membrane protein